MTNNRVQHILILIAILILSACEQFDVDEDNVSYDTYRVNIKLILQENSQQDSLQNICIKLVNSTGITFEAKTDSLGICKFSVPTGIYEASVSRELQIGNKMIILNGITSGIIVNKERDTTKLEHLKLIESKTGQIVIKELYVGGTQKDNGSGVFHMDKYVILHNNSKEKVEIKNFCLGMASPFNAHAKNRDYYNGKLVYEDKGFIPGITAIWYLSKMDFEPGQDILIALNGAINHTKTYSKSVDLSRADYVTYDPEDFENIKYHPAPSENIPTDHYFKAYKYGMGNAWPLSKNSPAFFIFTTGDLDPVTFASTNDYHFAGNEVRPSSKCVKVRNEWILDAIEVFDKNNIEKSTKRLTPDIDAGYAILEGDQGHTLYRNVNKEATENLIENKEKLIYNYNEAIGINTDSCSIDAEESIKNGAHIIYQDTNNSTKDFHLRNQSSLKEKTNKIDEI